MFKNIIVHLLKVLTINIFFYLCFNYNLVRGNIAKYESFDDFLGLKLKISKIELVLEKSNEVVGSQTGNSVKDDIWEIVYFKYNKLENNNANEINFDFNNKLLKIEIKNVDAHFLTNLKEVAMLDYSHESLNVYDIGYKTLSCETVRQERPSLENKNNNTGFSSLPLVNMQYNFTLNFLKIVRKFIYF